jgi:hypothetical protein
VPGAEGIESPKNENRSSLLKPGWTLNVASAVNCYSMMSD